MCASPFNSRAGRLWVNIAFYQIQTRQDLLQKVIMSPNGLESGQVPAALKPIAVSCNQLALPRPAPSQRIGFDPDDGAYQVLCWLWSP